MDMPEPTPTEIDSEDLEHRLIRLEARVDKEEKSLQRRIAAYAGLFALVISISTGSLSIYNAFFVAPDLKREAHAQNLSAALQEYSARSTELNSLPLSAPSEQRLAAAIGLNNARAALVAELRASDWKTISRLSSPDLSASAWVIADGEEFELSRRIAELAVEKATGFVEWYPAMNTLARTTLIADLTEGQRLYEVLFKRISTEPSLWRHSAYTVAATTETHVLAVTGKCKEFAARVEQHSASLQEMNVDHNNLQIFTFSVEANKALCQPS